MHETETSAPAKSQGVGRGALWITAAKVFFIVSSYGVQLALPRLLGSPEAFGTFSTVMSIVSMLTNVLIVATVQSVSKKVSENPTVSTQSTRQGLWIQLSLGLPLSALFIMGGPWFASTVLLDPKLGLPFQIMATVIFAYALYAALVGTLNGLQRFSEQAKLDITFSCIRTAGLLGGALMGVRWLGNTQIGGVLGAFSGFALASLLILWIAFLKVGGGTSVTAIPWRSWFGVMVPLWLYQLFINLMMQADLAVLKRTATEVGIAQGRSMADAAAFASGLSGLYRAAQTFAFVPYQLVLSVSFVIFPLISSATSAGDHVRAQSAIRQAYRITWLGLIAIAAPLAGASTGVMKLAYPADYTSGGIALRVLVFAQCMLALFVIGATALSSSGRPTTAASVAGVCVCLLLIATRSLIRFGNDESSMLQWTAIGTCLATTLAFTLATLFVYKLFSAWIPLRSFIRGIAAGAISFFVSQLMPTHSKLLTLFALVAGGLTYVTMLWMTREVSFSDFRSIGKLS